MEKLPEYLIFCKLHYVTYQVLCHHPKGSWCLGFLSELALGRESPGHAVGCELEWKRCLIPPSWLGTAAEPGPEHKLSTAPVPPSRWAQAERDSSAPQPRGWSRRAPGTEKHRAPSDAGLGTTPSTWSDAGHTERCRAHRAKPAPLGEATQIVGGSAQR